MAQSRKSRLGTTPIGYPTRQEIRRMLATEWLQTTDMKIAASLGYTSSSNFTRAFRAWTGQTPGELRMAKRGDHC
ncbi:helix-turn-helix domain-containing protein [Ruegeria arenilitoris]|uniref:helix-turn-helix domain-containing protein n=1 Tax=Ruegeria arenilitoris TaxID=1173585 RepID=UPI001480B93C